MGFRLLGHELDHFLFEIDGLSLEFVSFERVDISGRHVELIAFQRNPSVVSLVLETQVGREVPFFFPEFVHLIIKVKINRF